jgi:hypothetical protein
LKSIPNESTLGGSQPSTTGPDTSFAAFIIRAAKGDFRVHDLIHEPYTYDAWVRDQTVIDPLLSEYIRESGSISWGKKGAGNFYDWMAEIKGIQLTEEEESTTLRQSRQGMG